MRQAGCVCWEEIKEEERKRGGEDRGSEVRAGRSTRGR